MELKAARTLEAERAGRSVATGHCVGQQAAMFMFPEFIPLVAAAQSATVEPGGNTVAQLMMPHDRAPLKSTVLVKANFWASSPSAVAPTLMTFCG